MNKFQKKRFLLFTFLFFQISILVQINSQYYALKFKIDSGLSLTKALAISPITPEFLVGSQDGTIQVYNYAFGTIVNQINDHTNQILQILWKYNMQGPIQISIQNSGTKSLVIVRDSLFTQTSRWQFNEIIINSDCTSDDTTSYVGFNFQDRVQQYDIDTQIQTNNFQSNLGGTFDNFLYSPGHIYFFGNQISQNLWVMSCLGDSSQDYATRFTQKIQFMSTNESASDNYPVIIRLQTAGFKVIDPTGINYDVAFPSTDQVQQIYICENPYMIGITSDYTIILYGQTYSFQQLSRISLLTDNNEQINSIKCKNGHIFVTTVSNQIYVFQLILPSIQSNFWYQFLIIIGIILLILIVLFVRWLKKRSVQQNINNSTNYDQMKQQAIKNKQNYMNKIKTNKNKNKLQQILD